MIPTTKFLRPVKPVYICLYVLLFLPFTFFSGCNGDEDDISTEGVEEIAGTWKATSASFNGIDVVELGGSATLTIQNNGKFTLTLKRPGENDMVFTGRLGFDEGWLAVEYDTDPGEYEYYDITYDANNLHIGANSEFDFDGDGVDEFVIFFLDMVRQ